MEEALQNRWGAENPGWKMVKKHTFQKCILVVFVITPYIQKNTIPHN